jgi:hypothetical protein
VRKKISKGLRIDCGRWSEEEKQELISRGLRVEMTSNAV